MFDVVFIDNRIGGLVESVETNDGTTVAELVVSRVGASVNLCEYLIRVNCKNAEHDHILRNGDRISFTPIKLIYD